METNSDDCALALHHLRALGPGAAAAVPEIIPLLRYYRMGHLEEDDIGRSAFDTLVAIGRPSVEALGEALKNDPDMDPGAAAICLGTIGGVEAMSVLLDVVRDGNEEQQFAALSGIAAMDNPASKLALERLASGPESDKRTVEARSLRARAEAEVQTRAASDRLLQEFTRRIVDAEHGSAASALELIGEAETLNLLVARRNWPGLERLGSRVIEPLSRAMEWAFDEDLEAIAEILGNTRDPRTIDALATILRETRHMSASGGTYAYLRLTAKMARIEAAVTVAVFKVGPPGLDALNRVAGSDAEVGDSFALLAREIGGPAPSTRIWRSTS